MEIKVFDHFEKSHLFTLFDSKKPSKKNIYRVHNHPELELGFIKAGHADYILGNANYSAEDGMLFLVRPGEQHCVPTIYSDSLVSINIHISPYYLWNTALDYVPINALYELINGSDWQVFFGLNKYIEKLDSILNSAPSDDVFIDARRTILKLLIEICDKFSKNRTVLSSCASPSLNFLKIQNTISYIDKNYFEKIKVENLMKISKLNKTVFSNSFKKFTGLSAVEYITLKRLDNATELLKSTDNNIADIAFSCGFNNISHFNATFKEKFKITPREYRKTFKI